MRTHNQLHYYTIISMEVTVFCAVRQTLQCFHLTLRENNRSLAWFFFISTKMKIHFQSMNVEGWYCLSFDDFEC